MNTYLVTIKYIGTDEVEHTMQGKFSSIMLALTKSKATCLKNNVKEVKSVNIEELA